jgi:hypothetical protein
MHKQTSLPNQLRGDPLIFRWARKPFAASVLLVFIASMNTKIVQGGPILYTFIGTPNESNRGTTEMFRYTAPDFVTASSPGIIIAGVPQLRLLLSQLDSCTDCLTGISVPDVIFFPTFSEIQFNAFNNVGSAFLFPTETFTTPGTYNSRAAPGPNVDSAVLTVVAVPEPPTFLFVSLSMLVAPFLRKERVRKSSRILWPPNLKVAKL